MRRGAGSSCIHEIGYVNGHNVSLFRVAATAKCRGGTLKGAMRTRMAPGSYAESGVLSVVSTISTETEDRVRETVTRIKICGVTNREDALLAVEHGADALGFIFVPQTPRFVGEREDLRELLLSVPPFVTRTAVCTTAETLPIRLLDRLEAVQFYSPDFPLVPRKRMVQSFRIKDTGSLDLIEEALRTRRPDAIHLDTYHQDKMGGSGETFNWKLAVEAKRRFDLPLILSGGLTPENVGEAIATVRPYAVDVSSGVEAEPGRKDPAKIRAFCRAVREAER